MVIDRNVFALERLGQKLGIGRGRAPKRRDGLDHFEYFTVDESRGLDLAFEIFGGEVGAGGRQAWVIHSVRSGVYRSHAPPGIRRLPAAPAWPSVSRRRCRHAASFWHAR